MKRLSFVLMFAALVMTGFTLASCGDDDNNDLNEVENAIAASYVGNYSAKDSLKVGMGRLSWDYATANAVSYRITSNSNGTINITIPEETYANTQIGNIKIGSYTIDSLKYNIITGFTRAYKGSAAKVHFESTGGTQYPIVLNDDYSFTSDTCLISVKKDATGQLTVKNVYTLGKSPVLITNSFKGAKQ